MLKASLAAFNVGDLRPPMASNRLPASAAGDMMGCVFGLPWLVLGPETVFTTELPPSVCEERLRARLARPRWGVIPPPVTDERPVWGAAGRHGFRLVKVIRGRDSWQPVAWGRVEPSGDGTRVSVRLAVHPLVVLFEAAVGGIPLVGAAWGLSHGAAGAAIALVFPVAIAAMHAGARLANRDQDAFLVDFIRRVLGAEGSAESPGA